MKTLSETKYNGQQSGVMSGEKLRIYDEIKAYRKIHGLGSFRDISEATGGRVAIHTIANMYTGFKVKDETWLEVGTAMKKLKNMKKGEG